MPITLQEAKVGMADKVDQQVIDKFRRSSLLLDTLTFDKALSDGLKIMDSTAFALCKDNNMRIIVFDMNKPGNLERLIEGENIGTVVE